MADYALPTAKEFIAHFMEWLYYEEKKNADPRYLDTLHENAGRNNFTRWQPLANAGNGDQWCGFTVDGVAVECCKGSIAAAEYLLCQPQRKSMSGYTPDMEQWYKDAGRYHLTPEAGDQVFYYIASKGRTGHTGTVISVDKSALTFRAIEGNTSSEHYDDNGGCIAIHSYSYRNAGKSGERVRGFGRPRFAKEAVEEPAKEEEHEVIRNPEKLVKDIYLMMFHREADEGGIKTWVDFLANGGTTEDMLCLMMQSEEMMPKVIEEQYAQQLHRAPSADEVKIWKDAARAHGYTVSDILRKIKNSIEFKLGNKE